MDTLVVRSKKRMDGPHKRNATYADIEASRRDLGFTPRTPIDDGIPRFVDWYRRYHGA